MKTTSTTSGESDRVTLHDHEYDGLSKQIQDRVTAALLAGPVFTTDVDAVSDTGAPTSPLWAAYLDNLPDERQYHTCH